MQRCTLQEIARGELAPSLVRRRGSTAGCDPPPQCLSEGGEAVVEVGFEPAAHEDVLAEGENVVDVVGELPRSASLAPGTAADVQAQLFEHRPQALGPVAPEFRQWFQVGKLSAAGQVEVLEAGEPRQRSKVFESPCGTQVVKREFSCLGEPGHAQAKRLEARQIPEAIAAMALVASPPERGIARPAQGRPPPPSPAPKPAETRP